MNKKLFTQIKNEWRGNTWLAIELLVVSVVMWFITDMLYVRIATYIEPRGFDISHCYLIEMGMLNEKSPDYVPYQEGDEERDVLELVNRLQHRPDVEAASLSVNSYPYNGSNGTGTPVIMIQQSMSENRVGFAAALSVMVFVIVLIVVGLQKLLVKED